MKTLLKKNILYVLALLAATAGLYGKFLSNPVVFDDLYMFAGNTLANFGHSYFSFTLRWLPYATLGWTWNSFGENLIWFRLGNLLLHAATAIALFFFLVRLFEAVLPEQTDRLSHASYAFFGALLFALHPVAVFAAGYLVERSIVMATLFGLLTLYTYLQGLLSRKNGWFIASACFYFLAVFSKEHAVMIPAVAFALTLLIESPSKALFRRIALPFVIFALIGILIILKARGVLGAAYEPFALDMIKDLSDSGEKIDRAQAYPLSIATQSLLFFKYLGLWLLPNPIWMSVDMRERFASSVLDYLPAMALFLAYGATALWLLLQRGMKGLMGFAMLFPWLLFATEFSTVRIQESFVLYRSYLWMAGIFAMLPVFFSLVPGRKAAIWLTLIAILYVPLALDRLQDFSSPLYLWDDAARLVEHEHKQDLPGVPRIYHNRGLSFAHVFLRDKALEDYNTALRLKSDDSYTYNDRGALFYDWGRYPEAMKDFDKAISLNPDYGHFYWARGKVFEAMGNLTAARIDYRQGCLLGEKRACDTLAEVKDK